MFKLPFPSSNRLAWSVLIGLVAIGFLAPSLAGEGEEKPSSSSPQVNQPAQDTVGIAENSASVTGALQGQDGVRIQTMCTHCNSANIQVGGLSQDLVPISFGGYPLFGGLATSFVMNMLLPDSVAEAKVVKGPGEALQPGSAAGGTIQLLAASPKELPLGDLALDGGSFGRRSATIRGSGQITPWLGAVATLNREQTDVVDSDGDGWTDVAATSRKLADVRLRLSPSRKHSLDFGYSYIKEDDTNGRGAFDMIRWTKDQNEEEPTGKPFWTREDAFFSRKEFRVGWEWRLPNNSSLCLRMLRADRQQRVVSQDTTIPSNPLSLLSERYNIDERDEWLSLRFNQPLGFSARVSVGVETSKERVGADAFSPGEKVLEQVAKEEVRSHTAFAEWGMTPSTHWDVLVGARYDKLEMEGQNTTFGHNQKVFIENDTFSKFNPRVTVKFRPADGWTLRLVAGKTVRAPKPTFSEVCCGRKYLTNIQGGVRPETAQTFGFEGLYQPSPSFKTSLYLARTDFDDYVLQIVPYSYIYRQIYANTNIREARAETLEAAVRWSPSTNLRLDGSMGWLSFRNTGDRLVAVRYNPMSGGAIQTALVPVDRIPNRPVRTASAGASLTLPHQVVIGLQANYTGPQMIQQWLPFPPDEEEKRQASDSGLLDEMRPVKGFWLANLSLTAPLTKSIEFSAGLDNVTDFIQTDLGDPSRDTNWGPLAGRTIRFGVRFRLNR